MDKKHFEIMVTGDGRGNYAKRYVDVFCTKGELDIICNAMVAYVFECTDGGCCCIAKEVGSNLEYLYSDCM